MAPAGARNADWSRDETILLLDLYLRHPEAEARHPKVAALSDLLRDLARGDGSPRAANFRNAAGIAMKLRNLAQDDPAFQSSGRTGLVHGNRLNAEIWTLLACNPAALAKEVERIGRRRSRPDDCRPKWQPHYSPDEYLHTAISEDLFVRGIPAQCSRNCARRLRTRKNDAAI